MNKNVDMVAKVLLVIGGLNWGLVAISPKAELVQYLQVSWLIRLVYALVGISGLLALVALFKKKE
jgi:uncharacterized membrane protein YuzA (DUF378 family)